MSRISEIERPGLPLRIAYRIGERMFGVVPTPEKVMALEGFPEHIDQVVEHARRFLKAHVPVTA